ncbi:MAG: group II intron reverse transcriptase/maturase [Deltaproteobacteria bacterium]|nr:group II intron reverse transcriptase/maturase [Deltaproteobacteria bacterium]
MAEGGADRRAGRPERARRAGGGTAEGTGGERQAAAAPEARAGDEASGLMEEVLRRENLMRAYQRVVRNGGAPGIDGMRVEDLMGYCREHWGRIREELLQGTYRPHPVRRVEIPKPGGKGVRVLGIPTVLDRLIQQAVLQVLGPIFDPTFSDESYGFRPGRSAHQAVKRAQEHVRSGHRWVVDMDLEKFFDRVNHDVLMARVARRVKDKRVLVLIRRYLQAGMMEGGVVSARREGTPQGGPLSPLLSNILLDELDKELERRGHRFVRYADDCNVYVKSRAAGERVLESLERFLAKRLRLRVNREKSAVGRPWERKFLGYSLTVHKEPKRKVSGESVKRLKARLRGILRAGRGRRLGRVITELNRVLLGWVSYYRLAEVQGVFEELDGWIRRKLRCILWRQWKRPPTRLKKLLAFGLDEARASRSAYNGRGPWWNAGASHMNQAVTVRWLRKQGLVSLAQEHRRLASIFVNRRIRNRMYGGVGAGGG